MGGRGKKTLLASVKEKKRKQRGVLNESFWTMKATTTTTHAHTHTHTLCEGQMEERKRNMLCGSGRAIFIYKAIFGILFCMYVDCNTSCTNKFALQTFMCFSVCYPLLFEATMPRRYTRPDARASDTTSVDIQIHYPAMKLRVSRSASLIRRVTPRGSGSGVFREHRFPRRIPPNRRSRV